MKLGSNRYPMFNVITKLLKTRLYIFTQLDLVIYPQQRMYMPACTYSDYIIRNFLFAVT